MCMPSPVGAVVHPNPYPYYAAMVAERPLHFDEQLDTWVAESAAAVQAVLTAPGCRVRPPHEPVPQGITGTPAGDVFGNLVRMTDGEPQNRLKAIVTQTLGAVDRDDRRRDGRTARPADPQRSGPHAVRTVDVRTACPGRGDAVWPRPGCRW